MDCLTQTVPQDELLRFIEEKILDKQWVFLHSCDVKTLLRTGLVSPLDDGFSLFWENTCDKLYLQPMSEDWLFCKKSYVNSSPTPSSKTPEGFVLIRIKEE